jgi:hypothetical protein
MAITGDRPGFIIDVNGNHGFGPSLRYENDGRIAVFTKEEAYLVLSPGMPSDLRVLCVRESDMTCEWVTNCAQAEQFYETEIK